jgi:hypothetical protein
MTMTDKRLTDIEHGMEPYNEQVVLDLITELKATRAQIAQQQAELDAYRDAFQRWESKIDAALNAARAAGEGTE